MQLPDVNVLLNAFRADGSHHEVCWDWLARVCRGPDSFAMSHLALAAVIRIASNKRSFANPSTMAEAVGFADSILGSSYCTPVQPGPRHWHHYTSLLAKTGIKGPQTTDVWFAVLAIEWSCEWVTLDKGFARFPGLRWRHP